jgi:hypothetical protein
MTIPNWAMILGGGVLYHTLTSGKKIPVRSNPYGFVFLPILIGTGVLAAGFGTYKAMDAFHGYSGAGLYLGLALGGIYGLKNKQKGAIAAGALIGWALGTAYEKAV